MKGVPLPVKTGASNTRRYCHPNQVTSLTNNWCGWKVYLLGTGMTGAFIFGREAFWDGVRDVYYDKRNIYKLPITVASGIVLGTIVGIGFVPITAIMYAKTSLENAYKERKRDW